MNYHKLNNLLIYGGSFDPIHCGHLNTALAVQESAHFERFLFLPCKQSLLKENVHASSNDRLNMLKLALEPYPEFTLDNYEITHSRPSYMIETLQHIRSQTGINTAITLLMGLDTFLDLPLWNSWQQILSYSHLMILDRPNYVAANFNNELRRFVQKHHTNNQNDLLASPCGKIYQFNAGQHHVSSSLVRQKIQSRTDTHQLMPLSVTHYIKEHELYQLRSPSDPALSCDE